VSEAKGIDDYTTDTIVLKIYIIVFIILIVFIFICLFFKLLFDGGMVC
jgi:hypothetical protein